MRAGKDRQVAIPVFLIGFFTLFHVAYAQTVPVKLNLVFNQPKYAQGDTAFFRGRLFSAENSKLIAGRNVISLKLLAPDGKIRFHNRFIFQDGSCVNQLVLTNVPDQYTLVAYSEELTRQGNNSPILQMPFVISGGNEFIKKQKDEPAVAQQNEVFTSVVSDEESYSVRQPVTIHVNIADPNNKPMEGDFSASVIYSELFENTLPTNSSLPNAQAGVGKSPWVTDDNAMPYYFKGKVITENTFGNPVVTFYLNRNDFVYSLNINDPTGAFEFPLLKEFGNERIYYIITHEGVKVNGTIILDEPMIRNDSVKTLAPSSNAEDKYNSFAKKRNVVMKSFLYYSNKTLADNDEDWWLDSDFDIELDRFEPFSSMPEVLANIVQLVRYRVRDHEGRVNVFLKEIAEYASADPLYVIDGIMMDNTRYFLNLLPANIEKIGILRSEEILRRYGDLGKNGIIQVKTRSAGREELPTNLHELFVTGVNKSIPFKSPSYANEKGANIPDLRSTLYWNPKILTDDQGNASFSFYTGDLTGSFKVRIEGMTKNGILFKKEIPFPVSYNKP